MPYDPGSRTHKGLLVWHKGIQLGKAAYRLAKSLPPSERFELGSQIRTACASVTANIAEGKGRRTRAEYARFLAIARGSAREVDSHVELAIELEFFTADDASESLRLADEVSRMLTAMMRKLSPF
jgi:four helix bundle protein